MAEMMFSIDNKNKYQMADVLDACGDKNMDNSTDHERNATDVELSKSHINQERYNFGSGRGIAVIINNTEFQTHLNLPDRTGSDVDAASLYQRFQDLGFNSELLNDATKEDILNEFNKIKADKNNLKETDCLVVVVLTHRVEEHIYATNTEMKTRSIKDEFNAEKCPELILKPKIFIFQACRGNQIGRGVNVKVRDPNEADAVADYSGGYDELFGEIIRIPNEADFLAVYSSSPGYASFRNTTEGSPFIRYFSDELRKMKKGEDMYKVLTRVNRSVGLAYKPKYPDSNAVQMPCFVSHLTKELVLIQ